MQSYRGNLWPSLVLVAALCGACGDEIPSEIVGPDVAGRAEFEIAVVPSGVRCISVQASGIQVVSKTFAVTAGNATGTLQLGNLPLGAVTVTGTAFNVACNAIGSETATWIADPISTSVLPGAVSRLEFTFRRNSPATGDVSFEDGVSEIATGGFHGLALMTDGTARAWGGNFSGQLGDGTTTTRLVPVTIAALANVVAVAAGSQTSCALLADSSVKCWGDNAQGQLGDGTTVARLTPPASILGNVKQIAAAQLHTCAVTLDGGLKCWGSNQSGQLGAGAAAGSLTPQSVGLSRKVVQVSVSFGNTCVLYAARGGVECWGDNAQGQLGTGNTVSKPGPTGAVVFEAATKVVAGESFTCALRADHTVHCWGANFGGQLGNGTFTNRSTPGQLQLSGATDVTAGRAQACALLGNGSVKCWGDGQVIGNGTGLRSSVPLIVDHLTNAVALSAHSASCALLANGSVECWDAVNDNGELGNGSTVGSYVPVPVKF